MTYDPGLEITLRRVARLLSKLGLPFHLTGGLVSSFYGEPRFTQDIDLVVRLSHTPEDVKNLVSALDEDFIIDPEFINRAVARQDMFQALDKETYLKVDFHVGERIPGELDRSIHQEIIPGISLPVTAKEDAIASKLLWIAKGSEKSRQDVIAMLRNAEPVDTDMLRKTAASLGLIELLDGLSRLAFDR